MRSEFNWIANGWKYRLCLSPSSSDSHKHSYVCVFVSMYVCIYPGNGTYCLIDMPHSLGHLSPTARDVCEILSCTRLNLLTCIGLWFFILHNRFLVEIGTGFGARP